MAHVQHFTPIEAHILADIILGKFGDLGRALSADRGALAQLPGMSEAAADNIETVHQAALHLIRARALERDVLSSWDAVLNYCHAKISHSGIERFHVLFLDRKNMLIADEEMGRGTVDHCPVYPREVAKRAIELNASAVILIHNHPSGDPEPSRADIDMTKKIVEALRSIDVTVHDHIVIGHGRETSFRAAGLI